MEEEPDSGGPSVYRAKEAVITSFLSKVYRILNDLSTRLHRLIGLLASRNLIINDAAIPPDDENALQAWQANRQQYKEVVLRFHHYADGILRSVMRVENYVDTDLYEYVMRDVHQLRRRVFQLMPHDLHDRLMGKGKEVARWM